MTTSEVCPKRCLSCKIREFWHLAAIRFSTRRFSARDVPSAIHLSAFRFQPGCGVCVCVCVCVRVRVGVCFCVVCVCVCKPCSKGTSPRAFRQPTTVRFPSGYNSQSAGGQGYWHQRTPLLSSRWAYGRTSLYLQLELVTS